MNIYYIARGKKEEFNIAIELLKELYGELGDKTGSVNFSDNHLVTEILNSGRTEIYLAKLADNVIVGMAVLNQCQSVHAGIKFGLITEMYVKPAFRSKSIGKKLVEKIIMVAKERGWSRIDVTAPAETRWKRAVQFYENCGFIVTGSKLKYLLIE